MKIVLGLLAVILLAIGGVGAYLYFNSGALLKSAIEEYGSEAAGVAVRVGSVEVSLADGTGEIRDLRLANPPEFAGGDVMRIGLTRLGINVQESSETLIVLSELAVDAAELNVIARGRKTNVEALQARVASGDDAGSPSAGDGAAEPKVIVDRLRMTNTKANLDSDIIGQTSFKVPDVRLDKVGRAEGGITFDELAQRIISPITRDVTRELVNQGLGLDEAKERAREKIQSELDRGLKKLSERLKSRD